MSVPYNTLSAHTRALLGHTPPTTGQGCGCNWTTDSIFHLSWNRSFQIEFTGTLDVLTLSLSSPYVALTFKKPTTRLNHSHVWRKDYLLGVSTHLFGCFTSFPPVTWQKYHHTPGFFLQRLYRVLKEIFTCRSMDAVWNKIQFFIQKIWFAWYVRLTSCGGQKIPQLRIPNGIPLRFLSGDMHVTCIFSKKGFRCSARIFPLTTPTYIRIFLCQTLIFVFESTSVTKNLIFGKIIPFKSVYLTTAKLIAHEFVFCCCHQLLEAGKDPMNRSGHKQWNTEAAARGPSTQTGWKSQIL